MRPRWLSQGLVESVDKSLVLLLEKNISPTHSSWLPAIALATAGVTEPTSSDALTINGLFFKKIELTHPTSS